ncbi:MAG: MBL fold metallo-hydrolase [Ilumatobacteraceae bacterium]
MCQASDVLRRATPTDAPTAAPGPTRLPFRSGANERLILLGTAGASNPKATRGGYSNAIVVGEVAYIVDCGESVHRHAWQSGISMHPDRRPKGGSTVRSIFITHLHSDHVIDYINMLLGFWPTQRVDVFGPGEAGLPIAPYPADRTVPLLFPDAPTPGIRGLTDKLFQAFAYNINVRIADEARSDVTANVFVNEIGVAHGGYVPDIDLGVEASGASMATAAPDMAPVEISPLDDNGVRVTAILVQHAPVFPAFAYRFDTPSGSVVFSGDTGPCDNVVRLAEGADYLVHEVIDLDFVRARVAKLPNRDNIINHLTESHTSPEDAGRIASRAGVKTLVLSHLVPGDSEIPEEQWEARARSTFDGDVVCGVDLDQFSLCPATTETTRAPA